MTVHICDRCGDVTVDAEQCRCATAHEPVEARRRLRAAFARARTTDARAAKAPDGRRAA